MATKLLSAVFPLFGCAHEFSWPRRWGDGEYYQVCLRCGAEFEYDWSTMSRREPRQAEISDSGPSPKPERRANSWRPRARRLAVELPVRFRVHGGRTWFAGVVKNVSKSGLLVESGDAPEAGTDLVMLFEMPREISGQDGAKVIAQSRVVRVTENMIALEMKEYHFLRQ
ncbi:MAG TPA: PilZ domain-containing protein [Terriglobales bacterium]|nr:PilZ domain-containing protein [Terriglobales bacterium]